MRGGRDRFRTCDFCRVKVPAAPLALLVLSVCRGQPQSCASRSNPLVTAVVRCAMSQRCPNHAWTGCLPVTRSQRRSTSSRPSRPTTHGDTPDLCAPSQSSPPVRCPRHLAEGCRSRRSRRGRTLVAREVDVTEALVDEAMSCGVGDAGAGLLRVFQGPGRQRLGLAEAPLLAVRQLHYFLSPADMV
jgi:hypothetical protein